MLKLKGSIKISGDKSISHRALIFASLSTGKVKISNLLESDDVMRTVNILKELGIKIVKKKTQWIVQSVVSSNVFKEWTWILLKSLNLSVSVGTILFEITRQRREHSKKKLGLGNDGGGDDDGIGIPGYTLPIEEQIELVNALCSSAF